MAKLEKQREAQDLRKAGWSIKDISQTLNVSKSSASLWCRDVELTEEQIQELHLKMTVGGYAGRMKGAHLQRDRKECLIQSYFDEAKQEVSCLAQRELFFVGLGLYWGEGGKTNSGGVRMFNSDPFLVKIVMRWFREVLHVSDERFYMNIAINAIHSDRLDDVVAYWSRVTRIPISQFRKPVLIRVKNKKVYENHFQHHGTLCIRITKSTELLYKIKGLIKALGEAG